MLRHAFAICLLLAAAAKGQPPVPSTWEGEASGVIRGRVFRLPLTIEIKNALPHEKNPLHLSIATQSFDKVGDLLLASASELGTGGAIKGYRQGNIGVYDRTIGWTPGRGDVTLQYFTVRVEGNQVVGVLTETQAAAAASLNTFVGPNVSAEEASDLMRGVHQALGPTEIFVMAKGATIRLQAGPTGLTGSVEGKGRSVLNTSSDVAFRCNLRARRVK